MRFLLFAVVTIGIVLWSLWPRRERFPDSDIRLERRDQPELWTLADAVAAATGQASPRVLFFVDDVSAFVAERDGRLGFGGERIRGIGGLPLAGPHAVPPAD